MRFALSSLAIAALIFGGHCAGSLPPCDAQNAAIGTLPFATETFQVTAEPVLPVAPHIEGKAHYELGEKIKLAFAGSLPDGAAAAFAWTLPAGVESELVDGNSAAFVWAKAGAYKAELAVTYSIDILTPGPKFPNDPADIKQTKLAIVLPVLVHEFTVGPETPPIPPPGPKPVPVPTPDDPWGIVSTVSATLAALPESVKSQAPQTAALFRQAAERLEIGELASIGQAASWLQSERKKLWGANAAAWAPVENSFGAIWNSNWPLSKGQVIQFYRLVAAGLEAG